ncbi:hypothetical protein [Haloarcula argentinensis]|uniref:Uncharacterized protein n=1 Tax=Haloarcula argentinensis TaxID=43776 RepID=A0A830FW39_HALAR|nr:hypothetical protein [Haloarcula argentinensis]GGM49372.1 hypothetical protein GCM10009006_33280 [Haloarcula argentinensis]
MSSKYRHRNRGQKKLKWRWKDETDNRSLPQSWADKGRTESPEEDEVQLYAIQCRAGLLLEWLVNTRTGKLLRGPLSEKPGIRVLYVTADGEYALVKESEAREIDDSWKPPKRFASIIAKDPEEADPVPDSSQDYYRRSVEDLYDSP